jgi:hypothetical protein
MLRHVSALERLAATSACLVLLTCTGVCPDQQEWHASSAKTDMLQRSQQTPMTPGWMWTCLS